VKNRWLIAVLFLSIFCSGCARLGLKQARVELLPEQTILTVTLSNKGTPIQVLPLEAKLLDHLGNEYAALDYTGDLTEPIGKDYGESVSGTIIFPPIDPQSPLVKIDLITLMIAKERRYVSRISGEVENGISENMTFRR
jgi:hypothetical protein